MTMQSGTRPNSRLFLLPHYGPDLVLSSVGHPVWQSRLIAIRASGRPDTYTSVPSDRRGRDVT